MARCSSSSMLPSATVRPTKMPARASVGSSGVAVDQEGRGGVPVRAGLPHPGLLQRLDLVEGLLGVRVERAHPHDDVGAGRPDPGDAPLQVGDLRGGQRPGPVVDVPAGLQPVERLGVLREGRPGGWPGQRHEHAQDQQAHQRSDRT
jgi:hypothetical protein